MGLNVMPFRLDPIEYEECLQYIQQEVHPERVIVPRQIPELERLIDRICFVRGSYLVTGYRGVGKTSFINYALALAHQRLSTSDPPGILVRVHLSLARNYEIEKLLRRTIRQLYESLIQTKASFGESSVTLYTLLPDDLRAELTIAYQKTSAKVSEAASEALKTVIATATTKELGAGAEATGEATIAPPPLPAKLAMKLGGSYKRSNTTSKTEETAREMVDSLQYLEYDDEIAEAELMRLIKRLARSPVRLSHREIFPVERKWSWLWRIWGKIRGRDYLHQVTRKEESHQLHLVFVFDEVDKVSPDDAGKILKSLKGLLTSGDATFIFVGGWEFARRWLLRTQPEGDLLYSLFNDVIYIPLYSDDELDILIAKLVPAHSQDDEAFKRVSEHLKLHCGRTPRELLRQMLQFVHWEQGELVLLYREEDLFDKLAPCVCQVNSLIERTLPVELRDALVRYTDQWLMLAEREGVFTYDVLFAISRSEDTKGGVWEQALRKHFANFWDIMLENSIFQPEPGPTEEQYRFNQEFSIGTWLRRSSVFLVSEEMREPVAARGPFEAPPQLSHFVDRGAELRAISQALSTGIPIIQIVGMPGIGKSALAVRVAHEARNRFPDGVFWISGPRIDPKTVFHHIALSYGKALGDAELETLSAQVRALLADKRALIVVDSAEDLSEEGLKQLIPGAPGCVMLFTTRNSFEIERLGGRTISLGGLPREHSISLLRTSAGHQRVLAAQEIASEICEFLGDHPFAIGIAGRQAQHKGWDLQSLLEELTRVSKPSEGLIGRILSPLALSYEALTDEQKRVLTAASIFEASCHTEGVAYLLEQQDVRKVENLMDELLARSLVLRYSGGAYYLHPLVRTYVRGTAKSEDLAKMEHRHAQYTLRRIRAIKEGATK